jgi:hypothetical protein
MNWIDIHWIDILGYAASASVLVTFCMSTMVPLRIIAIFSNLLFAAFGAFAHIYPVMVLHLILFPVNITRLVQILQLIKGVRAAHTADLSIGALLPFMTHRWVKAGQILIHKGESADRMYYLVDGKMKIVDVDKTIERGAVIGEIGIFARNQKRTATVVCETDCEIYEMSESKAKQLYFQDRAFGFAVLQLIIARLLENAELLRSTPPAQTAEETSQSTQAA